MFKFHVTHKHKIQNDIYGTKRHICSVLFTIHVSVSLNDDRNHSIYIVVCNVKFYLTVFHVNLNIFSLRHIKQLLVSQCNF